MNDHLSAARSSRFHDHLRRRPERAERPAELVAGDVSVRPDHTGFGIFNYRGERVLEDPVDSCAEAARLAREIVTPWQGRVLVDDPAQR